MNINLGGHIRALAFLLICSLSWQQAIFALPQEYVVESGEVIFSTSDDNLTLNIQASDNAIINFNSFNIGQNETVNFIQQGSTSSALARVTGGFSSDIFGSLFSNGQLVLVNSNGINFHDTANVQVGSLIASTLDIQSSMYLQNNLSFEKLGGSTLGKILNEGSIQAADHGYVALLAEQIRNTGSIQANLGSVVLAAGEKQTLSFDGGGLINLVVDRGLDAANLEGPAVDNLGLLQANGGKIVLSAKTLNDVMDTLINTQGILEATRVSEKDGDIVFESNGAVQAGGSVRTTHLNIAEGTNVKAGDAEFKIEGDWDNKGEFKGENSTVEFTGAKNLHHISGESGFNNFKAYGANRTLLFEAGKHQTISGMLDLAGEYAELLKIHSTIQGSQYFIDVLSNYRLDFVDVRDSYQGGANEILITRSHSDGNIFGWIADPIWNGQGANNLWSTGANWDSGVAPGAGNVVTFDGTTGANPDKNSVLDMVGLSVSTFTIGAGYSGTIDLNGQSLTVSTAFNQSGGTISDSVGGGVITVTTGGSSVTGGAAGSWTGGRLFVNTGGNMTWTPGSVSWYDVQVNLPGGGCCDNLTIFGGDATVTNSFTLNGTEFNGNVNLAGNLFIANGAYGGGSFTLNGTGNQQISLSGTGVSPNLIINKASGNTSIASGSSDFTFQSGRTFTMTATGTGVFDLNGKTLIVPNFTQTAGTVTDSAGGGILRVTSSMTGVAGSWSSGLMELNNAGNFTWTPGATSYYDVTVDLPGGGCCDNLTVAGGDANVTRDLTLNRVEVSSGNINVQRNLIMTANVAGGAGSVTLNGTGTQTIQQGAGGSTPNITINKASGGTSITAGSSSIVLQANRAFTLQSTGTGSFDLNGKTIVTPTYTHTAGTVAGTGGGTIEVTSTMSGTSGTWTGGKLYMNIGGNLPNWSPGAVTLYDVEMNMYGGGCCDDFSITGGAATAYVGNDLTLTRGQLIAGTFDVGGNIITGTNWAGGTGGAYVLSGTKNQSLNFSQGNDPDSNFTINKTGGTVSLAADWLLDNAGQDLAITSGTLDLNGFNLTVNDQFTIGASGALRLAGTETVSAIDTHAGMTIFDGAGGAVPGGYGINGLGFAGNGTWNVAADRVVAGGFSILDTATVNFGGFNLTLDGNFTKAAGATLSNIDRVTFANSAVTSTITGSTTFNNLTVVAGKTVSIEAGSTQTVTGNTTMTGAAGNLITLQSTSNGSQWNFNPNASNKNLDYLNVRDSNNTSGTTLAPTNSVNLGNNLNWFPLPVAPVSNSGITQGVAAVQESNSPAISQSGSAPPQQFLNFSQSSDDAAEGELQEDPAADMLAGSLDSVLAEGEDAQVQGGQQDDSSFSSSSQSVDSERAAGGDKSPTTESSAQDDSPRTSTSSRPGSALSADRSESSDKPSVEPKKDPFSFDKSLKLGKTEDEITTESTSEVEVGEGSVDVNGNMVYDGEKAYVKVVRDEKRRTIARATALHMKGVYVATAKGLEVLRGKTHQSLKSVKTGSGLSDIVQSKKSDKLLLFTRGKDMLSFDRNNYAVKSHSVLDGGSADATLSLKEDKVFVADAFSDKIDVIDLATNKKKGSFQVGSMPLQSIQSADGRSLFVSNTLDGTVQMLDAQTGKSLHTYAMGQAPIGLSIDEKRGNLYVADYASSNIHVLDINKGQEKAVIKVGDGPYLLEKSADNKTLVVSNRKDDTISVIDLDTLTQRAKIDVGERPSGLAIEGDKVYVANEISRNISLVDLKNDQLVENIPMSATPTRVLVSDHKEGKVSRS